MSDASGSHDRRAAGDAEWVEEWYKRRREAEEFREWVLQRAEQERAAAQSLSEDDRHALDLAYQAGVDPTSPRGWSIFCIFRSGVWRSKLRRSCRRRATRWR